MSAHVAHATIGSEVCRCCGSLRVVDFLDLGSQPIANRYLDPAEPRDIEPHFPLHAFVCLECALIQLPNHIPASFFRQYLYVPSASATLTSHFVAFAAWMASEGLVPDGGYLVDIGCNEGLLLAECARRGIRVIGVDPAENLVAAARANGLDVVCEYFDGEVARALRARNGAASVVTCTNTFNHIDDLRGFVRGVAELLADDGVFIVEVPHASELLENNQFDTIYHEHLSEFTVTAIHALFSACDLRVFDVQKLEVHGGSVRVLAQRARGARTQSPRVEVALEEERARGLFLAETYDAFRDRVSRLRDVLRATVRELRARDRSVGAYGAPAKGMTLLSYCGFDDTQIDFAVDKSPLKQGRLTPGTRIPIVSPDQLVERRPDVLVLLAWNYLDEVLAQQAEYLASGGRFLVPIPWPRYVGAQTGEGASV